MELQYELRDDGKKGRFKYYVVDTSDRDRLVMSTSDKEVAEKMIYILRNGNWND